MESTPICACGSQANYSEAVAARSALANRRHGITHIMDCFYEAEPEKPVQMIGDDGREIKKEIKQMGTI